MNDTMAWVQLNLWHSSTVVTSVLRFAVNLILAPFIAFFFLRGGRENRPDGLGRLSRLMGGTVSQFAQQVWRVFGNYARGGFLKLFSSVF
jgi:predicted PurR-regulated permease PerM